MKNKFILTILLFSLVTFSSCTKEDAVTNDTNTSNSKQLMRTGGGILKFDNKESFAKILTDLGRISEEELQEFQQSNGYTSFGSLCDMSYEKVAKDASEPELVFENVNNYSEYLELVEDKEFEGQFILESKFDGNPFYYIMNEDRMYIIGELVYKVFDEGQVCGDISVIDELRGIIIWDTLEICQMDQFDLIPFDAVLWDGTTGTNDPPLPCDAGSGDEDRATNGNDRTKASYRVYKLNNGPAPQFANQNFVRPYHYVWPIWYHCTRSIDYSFNTAVDIHENSGALTRIPFLEAGSVYRSKVDIINVFFTPDLNDVKKIHYAGFDIWADTPSTGPVTFEKYTYNL